HRSPTLCLDQVRGSDPGEYRALRTMHHGHPSRTTYLTNHCYRTLGKIGDACYLDYLIPDHPKEGNGSCCSCMHRLARLEIGQDKLSIRVLDAGKLEAALNKPGTKGIEFIMVKQGEGWLTWND